MKALILAGGRGNRLDPITEQTSKPMLPLHGKPLIEFSLENAIAAGASEIVIVVGYLAEQIINAYGNVFRGIPLRYVIQWEQKGLVNAIECAREQIGKSDFMLFLADEILFEPKHVDMLRNFEDDQVFVLCGVTQVEDRNEISKTYSIIGSENRIFRLIEKPARPMNPIMGTGNCVFRNQIFDYIAATPINQKRGEKELPDLIQCAIDDGQLVKSFVVTDQYININSHEELARAQSALKAHR